MSPGHGAPPKFQLGISPIYENVIATPTLAPELIQVNLVEQLTSPVQWTQTVQRMIQDGAQCLLEYGPEKVLPRLVKKMDATVEVGTMHEEST